MQNRVISFGIATLKQFGCTRSRKYFHLKISEPEFDGDLVYRLKQKNVGKSNFSEQFRKLLNRYKRISYSLDTMRQTACLVVNPIIVDGYVLLWLHDGGSGLRLSDGVFVKL